MRHIKRGRGEKKILKRNTQGYVYNTPSLCFQEQGQAPHTLLELSKVEHKIMNDNTIHVTFDLKKTQQSSNKNKSVLPYYNVVSYGSNIVSKRRACLSDGIKFHYKNINISSMKSNYFIITADKSQCVELFPNTKIFDSSYRQSQNHHNQSKYDPSGIVLLLLRVNNKNTVDENKGWGQEDVGKLKLCKSNTIKKSTQHFNSSGYIGSFGNRANYGMIDNSSVNIYELASIPHLKSKVKRVLVMPVIWR